MRVSAADAALEPELELSFGAEPVHAEPAFRLLRPPAPSTPFPFSTSPRCAALILGEPERHDEPPSAEQRSQA
jgi:hypothetical protein